MSTIAVKSPDRDLMTPGDQPFSGALPKKYRTEVHKVVKTKCKTFS